MMTLKEAIEHATEISETCDNKECGLDHKQLANWLTELEELREEHKQNVMNMLATDYAENHTSNVEYRYTNCTVRDFYNANKAAYIAGFKEGLKYCWVSICIHIHQVHVMMKQDGYFRKILKVLMIMLIMKLNMIIIVQQIHVIFLAHIK